MGITTILKVKELIEYLTGVFGYEIIISGHKGIITLHKGFPKDMDREFKKIYEECKSYTITAIESMYALYKAIEYIVNAKVPGDFVECGVWKGGSSMIMTRTLLKMRETERKMYLYDTFTGMSKPIEKDFTISNTSPAIDTWKKKEKKNYNEWAYSPIDEVKKNMRSTGYPEENVVFVKGKVEDTIPGTIPSQIALLRLDTDWYESTYHELKHLFPLLSHKGVLIIDDYGHFAGAREAVDQYFQENNITILLNRVDYTVRLAIKL